jgi:hypothetical protein
MIRILKADRPLHRRTQHSSIRKDPGAGIKVLRSLDPANRVRSS